MDADGDESLRRNDIIDDPGFSDQAWVKEEGMVDRLVQITPSEALPPDDMTLVVVKCTRE